MEEISTIGFKINLIKGRWEDVIFECEKYNCVYFDDHPEEGTSLQVLVTRVRDFFIEILKNHSFIGTKLCYYVQNNFNPLEGISCITSEIFEYNINIPDNCIYTTGDKMYIPIHEKKSEYIDDPPKSKIPQNNISANPYIVIDNFYSNCIEVHDYIIKENFNNNISEKSYIRDEIKNKFEKYLNVKIKKWDENNNGYYHVLSSYKNSGVCVDNSQNWVGILFMSMFVPYESGVNIHFFNDGTTDKSDMNNKNNKKTLYKYRYDSKRWFNQDKIGNRFNRLVLIRPEMFYSIDHFGTCIGDGNLVQIFNFTTC